MILKLGDPVVCYIDVGTHNAEIMSPVLGCITGTWLEDNEYIYKISWSDNEEEWYDESWAEFYRKQALVGKMLRTEQEQLEDEYEYGW